MLQSIRHKQSNRLILFSRWDSDLYLWVWYIIIIIIIIVRNTVRFVLYFLMRKYTSVPYIGGISVWYK